MSERAGYINGKHFTDYSCEAFQLKRGKKYDLAIDLLLQIIDAAEAESKAEGWDVAAGYYEDLANIYKKLRLFDAEIQILDRFAAQQHAPGVKTQRLMERLRKLKLKEKIV